MLGSSSKWASGLSGGMTRALKAEERSRQEARRRSGGEEPKVRLSQSWVSSREASPRAETTAQLNCSLTARKPSRAPGMGLRRR